MKQIQAALPTTLRQQNYFTILNTFRGAEALSANEVSARTGISRATVMKAVGSFIEKGLLESAGKGPSTEIGGKKPELFQFCMKRYLLCVGLLGDEMTASIFNLKNELLVQKTVQSNMKESITIFLDTVQKTADELLAQVEDGPNLLYGVSLFVGGVLEAETGVMQYSVLTPDWGRNVPLKQMLAERFPQAEIVVDNVARMAACAAVLDNPEYEQERVAVIYTDVGASACYIDRGHVQHGPHSMIGEIGPMVIALGETEPYTAGEQAYFSTLVSEEVLCAKAAGQPEKLKASALYEHKDNLKLRYIFEAADAGDLFAREIVRHAAWVFSAVLHNIVLNFDPGTVIMQGNFSHAGAWFDACLREGIACFPCTVAGKPFEIVYDQRPLIELQMKGARKVLTRKFFSSPEWL